MPKALCQADEPGLVTVRALPAWWRQQVEEGASSPLTEEFARIGEEARSDDVCGARWDLRKRASEHRPHSCDPYRAAARADELDRTDSGQITATQARFALHPVPADLADFHRETDAFEEMAKGG
ncbi:hypothetical protein ABZ820_08560 [Streptomyces diacarni]|uniref:hypothetical protein n=1 Tax=Streptomyces diacarni TaxID=2800381 RepID=UPI0033F012BC